MEPIPQQRIIEKLDEYMSHRDYEGAEKHLLFWLDEARALGDERGELMVRNELVGHFRKTGDKEKAFEHAEAALALIDKLDFGNTISAGTTYTNVATAFNAFGENERSYELFCKARELYEGSPNTSPKLLGGLYNNMALVCVSLQQFDEAAELYQKALATAVNVENSELELAITYLNIADAAVAKAYANTGTKVRGASPDVPEGEDAALVDAYAICEREVNFCLDKALELIDVPTVPRDGYYAFVCEKCAPTFGYYGYFLADADLRERAKAIYERD